MIPYKDHSFPIDLSNPESLKQSREYFHNLVHLWTRFARYPKKETFPQMRMNLSPGKKETAIKNERVACIVDICSK